MLISNTQVSRDGLVDLLASHQASLSFENCTFDEEDLSGLVLEGLRFSGCSFLDTRLTRSKLQDTVWQRCKMGRVDFSLTDLSNLRWARRR